ncbi:IS630 family transposase, partial [Bradyrhizobium sp. 164]|nr:IS630 family transposase [Bradyrhizobium sp. 164]
MHASEQDRPDVVERRQAWRCAQTSLGGRLIFLDETWTTPAMTRRYAWANVGTRALGHAPHGHWKTTTFLAGLTCEGLIAPFVLDGPINAECFFAYVEQVLVPALREGDTVILDNLSSHKNEAAARLIAGAGARLLFLPPYSPDLNPIEMAFAKLKELCGKPKLKPSMPSGTSSAALSASLPLKNAPTTSVIAGIIRFDRNSL